MLLLAPGHPKVYPGVTPAPVVSKTIPVLSWPNLTHCPKDNHPNPLISTLCPKDIYLNLPIYSSDILSQSQAFPTLSSIKFLHVTTSLPDNQSQGLLPDQDFHPSPLPCSKPIQPRISLVINVISVNIRLLGRDILKFINS